MKYFDGYYLIRILVSASVLGLGFTTQIYAATDTDQFDVTITIVSTCAIDAATAGDVDFASQASTATNIQVSTASISVTCTSGTPYSIALNDGANADGTSRRMQGQSVGTDFVAYELYSDAYTTLWGDGTTFGAEKGGLTGNGLAQGHTIYAQVPSANFPAQNYEDTVTATVTW